MINPDSCQSTYVTYLFNKQYLNFILHFMILKIQILHKIQMTSLPNSAEKIENYDFDELNEEQYDELMALRKGYWFTKI